MAADNLNEDIREIRQMMTDNLRMTTEVHTILFPAPGQPNAIQAVSERVDKLETWRSYLAGAWAVISAFFGMHVLGKH